MARKSATKTREINDLRLVQTGPITDFVVEGARDGRSVADLMEAGAQVITARQCMDGIPSMIHSVLVEATFPDGTKLVTLSTPRSAEVAPCPA